MPLFVIPKDNYDSLGPVQNEKMADDSNNTEPETDPFSQQGNEEPARTTSIIGNNEAFTRESEQFTLGMTENIVETTPTIPSVATLNLPTTASLTTRSEELSTPLLLNTLDPIDSHNPILTHSPIFTATPQQPVQNEGVNTLWSDLTQPSG